MLAAGATCAIAGHTGAETPRDNWCGGVKLRFFAGGAEGDAFALNVYNGAVQAATDTGVTTCTHL